MSLILRDHEVCVVGSVKEALGLLASKKRFDVIFSDLMMPQMSGMDFYEELARRSPEDAGRSVDGARAACYIACLVSRIVSPTFR